MSRSFSFETEIESCEIIPQKLDKFVAVMKNLGHLTDPDIFFDEDTVFFEDLTVTVEFGINPGCKGSRDGRFGPPIEPDEPAHIEDFIILVGKEDITDYFYNPEEKFEDECWEWVRD